MALTLNFFIMKWTFFNSTRISCPSSWVFTFNMISRCHACSLNPYRIDMVHRPLDNNSVTRFRCIFILFSLWSAEEDFTSKLKTLIVKMSLSFLILYNYNVFWHQLKHQYQGHQLNDLKKKIIYNSLVKYPFKKSVVSLPSINIRVYLQTYLGIGVDVCVFKSSSSHQCNMTPLKSFKSIPKHWWLERF